MALFGNAVIGRPFGSNAGGTVEQQRLSNANIFDALDNLFTGNLDAKRNIANAQQAQAFNALEAEKAREFSSHEAEISRSFNALEAEKAFNREKDLYSQRYQLQVEDLKKAGLNPALAYSLGAGTLTSPSASSAPASSVSASGGSAYSSKSGIGFSIVANMLNNAFKATNAVASAEMSRNISSASSLSNFLKLLTLLAVK